MRCIAKKKIFVFVYIIVFPLELISFTFVLIFHSMPVVEAPHF